MLLPEVWGLLRYWRTRPPFHLQTLPFYQYFTGAQDEVVPRDAAPASLAPDSPNIAPGAKGRATPQDAAALRALARGPVKTLDQLPLAIQQAIAEQRKQ